MMIRTASLSNSYQNSNRGRYLFLSKEFRDTIKSVYHSGFVIPATNLISLKIKGKPYLTLLLSSKSCNLSGGSKGGLFTNK
jgi:hypothetical protein